MHLNVAALRHHQVAPVTLIADQALLMDQIIVVVSGYAMMLLIKNASITELIEMFAILIPLAQVKIIKIVVAMVVLTIVAIVLLLLPAITTGHITNAVQLGTAKVFKNILILMDLGFVIML